MAAPGLLDPNFRRTVVYLIEHRERGSLGVVLNRPSECRVRDVLPSWAPLPPARTSVFVGGPVEGQTALCLAAVRTGAGSGRRCPGSWGCAARWRWWTSTATPSPLASRLRGLRVFAGYAGWDAGQLAGEIGRGDWFVVPALPDDVLAGQGPNLWWRVLRRQGVPLALLATFPVDARQN